MNTLSLDIQRIRSDFPILQRKINNKPLIYFDNAATTQKPLVVLKTLEKYYCEINSNIHRGIHRLSTQATIEFENSRKNIQKFINAKFPYEIIFTRGTTEAVNLTATTFGKRFIHQGDEIIISTLEHHSNIVPWQILCENTGARLKIIPIHDNGEIIFEEYEKLLTPKAKIVAITHISNSLGTIIPVKKIVEKAHEYNVPVLIDGAQGVPHQKIDVQKLDCDFYCFSGHKIYGPTGIGVLYGKEKLLDEMPPYQGGGQMIKTVSFEKTTFEDLPFKFEAGTPNIAGAIGLSTAIDYINSIGYDNICEQENELLSYATNRMSEIENLKIYGTAENKASIISFMITNLHHFDIGTILDQMGIAVRTGHHCTQPLMKRLGIPGTVRASLAFYNTKEEIDTFIEALNKVKSMFKS